MSEHHNIQRVKHRNPVSCFTCPMGRLSSPRSPAQQRVFVTSSSVSNSLHWRHLCFFYGKGVIATTHPVFSKSGNTERWGRDETHPKSRCQNDAAPRPSVHVCSHAHTWLTWEVVSHTLFCICWVHVKWFDITPRGSVQTRVFDLSTAVRHRCCHSLLPLEVALCRPVSVQ